MNYNSNVYVHRWTSFTAARLLVRQVGRSLVAMDDVNALTNENFANQWKKR